MKRFLKLTLATGLVLSGIDYSQAAVQMVPYLDVRLMGGRSGYSGGASTGFIGNLDVIPALNFNEAFSLLPVLSYSYRQNRDVQELVEGGGFLTQEDQERGAALRAIYRFKNSWRAKAHFGYKDILVKETKDEGWGNGLFDHTRVSESLELERMGSSLASLRFGVGTYQTRFPNFSSLASLSPDFGTEVKAGGKTLDFNAVDLYTGTTWTRGRSTYSPFLLVSQRSFSDQHIVNADGSFSSSDRRDLYSELSMAYRIQLIDPSIFQDDLLDLRSGLDAIVSDLDSNQNSYDAARFHFTRDFYDYKEWKLGPVLDARLRKWKGGLSYTYGNRYYGGRETQTEKGAFTSKNIATQTQTFRWNLGYELRKGLSLELQGAMMNTHSNMHIESLYRYNVSSQNIFAGISYQL